MNEGAHGWWLWLSHVMYFKVKFIAVLTVQAWAVNQNNSSLSSLSHTRRLSSAGPARSMSKEAWSDWANRAQTLQHCFPRQPLSLSACVLKALSPRQAEINLCVILRKPTFCRGFRCAILLMDSPKPNSPSLLVPVLQNPSQPLLIRNRTTEDQKQFSVARDKSGSKELTSASVHSER